MRAAHADHFERRLGVLPISEAFLDEALGWRLLGYDIGDGLINTSGFYHFGWEADELAQVFPGVKIVFNRYGLLDDEDLAIRLATTMAEDLGTRSHAPFFPVKIWVQQRK